MRLPLYSATDILHNARLFDGKPYGFKYDDTNLDCSGLITVACGLRERWSTSSKAKDLNECGPFVRVYIPLDRQNKDAFIRQLVIGDIIVWRDQHVVIYAGGESIYHSSNKGIGETHDLKRYWLGMPKNPEVYRFNK